MPCYHPVTGYQSAKHLTKNGKLKLVFDQRLVQGQIYDVVKVPCGRCIGCRLDRSRDWAIRCVHEATLFDYNCFITLTYAEDKVPKNGSLDKRAFQKFMKRLRKKHKGKQPVYGTDIVRYPIRYFMCGEYGTKFQRPHYHACLFNFDFEDKELWSTRDGVKLYRSEDLETLWTDGYATVGDVSYESAAYVARYCTKKITGDAGIEHYLVGVDEETGECEFREPEFAAMSRRPGIGKLFYERYKTDMYPKDFITHNGTKHPLPPYYDKLHMDIASEAMKKVKMVRRMKQNIEENTGSRLQIRKKCKQSQIKTLKRSYENGTQTL